MDDMLSSILNDPEKLQSAISMASSMLGGGAAEAAPAAGDAPPKGAPASPAKRSAKDPNPHQMKRAKTII